MEFSDHTIKEVKKYLKEINVTDKIITRLADDSRKGVKKLASKYRRKKEKEMKELDRWKQMNKQENKLRYEGYELVVGLDEAGRGPLAGPVVAAAVILNPECKIIGLNDSKKMSLAKREKLFAEIENKALAVGTGIVENDMIDKINIQQASFLAMEKALHCLDFIPDYLLVDGNREIPEVEYRQRAIVDGDAKVNCIAAASIIAKVTRDKIIDEYDEIYPQYGFISNKGYGTQEHIKALKEHGPSPIHRYSYSVVEKHSDVG